MNSGGRREKRAPKPDFYKCGGFPARRNSGPAGPHGCRLIPLTPAPFPNWKEVSPAPARAGRPPHPLKHVPDGGTSL
jgi:hypothetical protein